MRRNVPEGEYDFDRSFLWNVVHYQSVNYDRLAPPGNGDAVQAVMNIRGLLILLALGSAIVGAVMWFGP